MGFRLPIHPGATRSPFAAEAPIDHGVADEFRVCECEALLLQPFTHSFHYLNLRIGERIHIYRPNNSFCGINNGSITSSREYKSAINLLLRP